MKERGWKLVSSVLSKSIDPAGDISFVREIIEAHKAGDFLLETFLVAALVDRLRGYNFASVSLN